jgi:hypothetical protein
LYVGEVNFDGKQNIGYEFRLSLKAALHKGKTCYGDEENTITMVAVSTLAAVICL